MNPSDSNALLDKISLIVDNHEKALQDSEQIIQEIEKALKSNFQTCGYNPQTNITSNTDRKFLTVNRNVVNENLENLTTEDQMLKALVKQIRIVLNSSDKTITVTESASELVKNLVDLFLSTVENPYEKNDLELMEFIKFQQDYITAFIDRNCRNKMLSCLNDKLTEGNQLLKMAKSSKEDFEIPPKVSSSADTANKENSIEKKDQSNEKHLSDIENDLQKNLQLLNTEVESQFTDLVVDQIDGLEEISRNVSKDTKKSEIFSIVKSKYLDDQNKENQKDHHSKTDEDSIVSKIEFKKGESGRQRNSFLFSKLMDTLNTPSLKSKSDKPIFSGLVKALDAAIDGLEEDIRLDIYKKIQKTNNISSLSHRTPSLFDNMTFNN